MEARNGTSQAGCEEGLFAPFLDPLMFREDRPFASIWRIRKSGSLKKTASFEKEHLTSFGEFIILNSVFGTIKFLTSVKRSSKRTILNKKERRECLD